MKRKHRAPVSWPSSWRPAKKDRTDGRNVITIATINEFRTPARRKSLTEIRFIGSTTNARSASVHWGDRLKRPPVMAIVPDRGGIDDPRQRPVQKYIHPATKATFSRRTRGRRTRMTRGRTVQHQFAERALRIRNTKCRRSHRPRDKPGPAGKGGRRRREKRLLRAIICSCRLWGADVSSRVSRSSMSGVELPGMVASWDARGWGCAQRTGCRTIPRGCGVPLGNQSEQSIGQRCFLSCRPSWVARVDSRWPGHRLTPGQTLAECGSVPACEGVSRGRSVRLRHLIRQRRDEINGQATVPGARELTLCASSARALFHR